MPRGDNVNGARAKTRTVTTVPVSAALVRLYSDYMHTEYGDLDYVFVNLFSEPVGRPLRYDAVAKLVARLRARTGIEFTPHVLRHTRATDLKMSGIASDASFDKICERLWPGTSAFVPGRDVLMVAGRHAG